MRSLILFFMVLFFGAGCGTTETQNPFGATPMEARLEQELALDFTLVSRSIYIFVESGRLTFENEEARKAAIRILVALSVSGGVVVPPDAIIVLAVIYAQNLFRVGSEDRLFAEALKRRIALAREDWIRFSVWFKKVTGRARHEYAVLRTKASLSPLSNENSWLKELNSTRLAIDLAKEVLDKPENANLVLSFLAISEQHAKNIEDQVLCEEIANIRKLDLSQASRFSVDVFLKVKAVAQSFVENER